MMVSSINKSAAKHKLREQVEEVSPLTDDEFDYIFGLFDERRIEKYDFIIQKGFSVPYDFMVVEGCVKAHVIDDNGREHILQFAKENCWISDYEAHFKEQPATINIDCIEDCILLSLTLDNRRKICREFPEMDRFFSTNLGNIPLQQRVLSLMTQNAEQKYYNLIEKEPDLIQRVPKEYLAEYLGLSSSDLCRMAASSR